MREAAGKCDVCGLSGFPEASLSITEGGQTCQPCYFKWEQAQRAQMLEAEREAKNAVHRTYRWRLLAGAVLGLIMVVASSLRHCGH
jgi:hypothetical protein